MDMFDLEENLVVFKEKLVVNYDEFDDMFMIFLILSLVY